MIRGATGILGGTFNPIHVGHLRAAEEARDQLGLSQVRFLPSATPPLKTQGSGENFIAPADERSRWVELAIADHPDFELDTLELTRDGPSYTIDSLAHFAGELAPARPVFLVGCDALVELEAWHKPEGLFELADFAVVVRPPSPPEPLRHWLPRIFHESFDFGPDGGSARHHSGSELRLLEIAGLEVSSTDLRRRLREGRSVRYLIPEAAREAVLASGYFSE